MELKLLIAFTKCFKYVAGQFRNYTPNTETDSFVCSMESCTFVSVCVYIQATIYFFTVFTTANVFRDHWYQALRESQLFEIGAV
jgi:hypothetical protein